MPKRQNPSHTLLGIPGAKKGDKKKDDDDKIVVDEEQGGSTMFGMGTTRASRGGPLGGRKPTGRGVRQTLMGLGSVKLLNEPSENVERPFEGTKKPAAPARGGNVRSTMTGLPGINLEKKPAKGGRPRLPGSSDAGRGASPRSTMMGMPALTDADTKKGKKAPPKPPPKIATRGQDDAVPTVSISDDHIQKARQLAQKYEKPKAEAPAVEEEEEFDPLAGFTGAQEPKVSSLMDEEVENLSAQVFGDEFGFGDEDYDDDEDDDDEDYDFDFAGTPSDGAGSGDIPEEDVHHDVQAAEAALSDMMADLEDVMPTEDEAALALGLDESKVAAAHAAVEEDEDATIADANVEEMMAEAAATVESQKETEAAKKPEPKVEAKPAAKAKAKPAASAGGGMGLGGMLAILGGIAAVAWLFIPVDGATAVSAISGLDVASQVLVVFSAVAAILAIVTALMKLPGSSKGLVVGVLGIGLGALSVTAPVLVSPLNITVYAAAGLFIVSGALFAFAKKKT